MNVALVSLASSGTGGHRTLLNTIADGLTSHRTVLITDTPVAYANTFSDVSALTPVKGIKSTAGRIEHPSSDDIVKALDDHRIEHVVFSTFFDERVLEHARSRGLERTLVSYPLRDTFRELFFLRAYERLFDNVVILEDFGLEQPYREQGARIARYDPKIAPGGEREQNILVSCGGGGLPSASTFFSVVSSALEKATNELADYAIDVSYGTHNQPPHIGLPNVTVRKWFPDFVDRARSSRLVIGEAGYFTTHEAVSTGTPMILIPGHRRTDNQELRAVELERRGYGTVVFPEEGADRLYRSVVHSLRSAAPYVPPSSTIPTVEDAITAIIEGRT
ncbi:MAG: glycosyltransferase [Candidatus Woesearchaeota archaeon]